jgi:hypothetical protein
MTDSEPSQSASCVGERMTIDIMVSKTGDHVLRGPRLVAAQSVFASNVAQSMTDGSVSERTCTAGVCDGVDIEYDGSCGVNSSPGVRDVMMDRFDRQGTRIRRRTTNGRSICNSYTVSVPASTQDQKLSKTSDLRIPPSVLPVLSAFQLRLPQVISRTCQEIVRVVSTSNAGYGYDCRHVNWHDRA